MDVSAWLLYRCSLHFWRALPFRRQMGLLSTFSYLTHKRAAINQHSLGAARGGSVNTMSKQSVCFEDQRVTFEGRGIRFRTAAWLRRRADGVSVCQGRPLRCKDLLRTLGFEFGSQKFTETFFFFFFKHGNVFKVRVNALEKVVVSSLSPGGPPAPQD